MKIQQANEKAGERSSTSGVSTKFGRGGNGVSEKGEGVGRKEITLPSLASPSAPYFLHSLPVSFPSRKFLETPATQASTIKIIKMPGHNL